MFISIINIECCVQHRHLVSDFLVLDWLQFPGMGNNGKRRRNTCFHVDKKHLLRDVEALTPEKGWRLVEKGTGREKRDCSWIESRQIGNWLKSERVFNYWDCRCRLSNLWSGFGGKKKRNSIVKFQRFESIEFSWFDVGSKKNNYFCHLFWSCFHPKVIPPSTIKNELTRVS